jgi:V/A-type H+-transporting ATPase subunit I
MSFRSRPINWFEVETARDETVAAIEALAETESVEFYHLHKSAERPTSKVLQGALQEFKQLLRKHTNDLPDTLHPPILDHQSPEQVALHSMELLREWDVAMDSIVEQSSAVSLEIESLRLLRALLAAIPDHDLALSWIEHDSQFLFKKLFTCPADRVTRADLENVLLRIYPAETRNFVLFVGTREHLQVAEAAAAFSGCQEIEIPDWLRDNPDQGAAEIASREASLQAGLQALQHERDTLRSDHRILSAFASMRLMTWYLGSTDTERGPLEHCHTYGWTAMQSADQLQQALDLKGVQARVRFCERPIGNPPPVFSPHARWIRPFSLFVRFAGVPRQDEIDPTPLLALVVPLLFGYMFPDIGHGLMLVVAGLWIRRYRPEATLLIPAGMTAAAFGWLFGDFFGYSGLVQPLWLEPLNEPLWVLVIPIVGGVLLILTGLVFSAIEAYWRQQLSAWFRVEAAVLLLYLVILSSLFNTAFAWLLLPVSAWYLAGSWFNCRQRSFSCLLAALGSLLDSALRLVLNSISFVRVGAFALAHAGTSFAINSIAEIIDNPLLSLVFLVLGHIFIVAFEGLIVFVQTTRLILFEFFIRFLRADGRVFKPENASRL